MIPAPFRECTLSRTAWRYTLHREHVMTFYALIESQPLPSSKHRYRATVIGLPNITAAGETRHEAIERLRTALADHLKRSEIVALDIDGAVSEHPLAQFSGMFKDNPLFRDVVAEAERYRTERNTESNDATGA